MDRVKRQTLKQESLTQGLLNHHLPARQTGRKGQEGLDSLPKEGREALRGEKHTGETHKVN